MTAAKTLDDYLLALPYRVEITRNADGSWFAKVPELPGCMTSGRTPPTG